MIASRIVGASLNYRFLVLGFAALIVYFGINRLREMPVDVFPEFTPTVVEIQTEALGLSASEVESLITLNMEELLSGVSWLKSISSKSVPGMSSIQLTFESGTDIMRARQVVQERISLAYALPNISKQPIMLQPLSVINRAMMIGLSSKKLTPMEISVLAKWTIKPRLLGVKGVANVVLWGERKQQLQVQIDPKRLKTFGVTQDQIIQTTGDSFWVSPLSYLEASIPGSGGWIDTPNQRLGIRHILPISKPADLAKMPVSGTSLQLGDVTNVVEGHPPLIGDVLLKDGTGVMLVVEKLPGANTLSVTKGVEEALTALRLGLPGLDIDTSVYRSATFIESAIQNLTTVFIISAILVIIVLGLFLLNWRAALISILAIPLSLLGAVLVLSMMGLGINMMILAGFMIALGVIVDDAIIDVQNILRRIRKSRNAKSEKSLATIMLEASLEVRRAITYATLIMVLAVVPVYFMEGLSGAFFKPLVLSYALALLVSMVIALTVTPALSLILLRKESIKSHEIVLGLWLMKRYDSFIKHTINAPNRAILITAALLIIGIGVWPFLWHELLPSFKERYALIDINSSPGTSHTEMKRILNRARSDLQLLPGVANVTAQIGRGVTGDQVVNINTGQLWVNLSPKAPYNTTFAAIKAAVANFPGVNSNIHTYLRERISNVLTGASESIVVRLYGLEQTVLRSKAEEIKKIFAKVHGLVDLQVKGQVQEPHVEIKVDIAKANPYGIKPGDVRRAASTIFAGIDVGYMFEEQKVFDVVVWGIPEARQSISNIKNLLIDTPKGGHVRLADIAEVRVAPTPSVIKHIAISPYIDIVANVKGRDHGAVTHEIKTLLKYIDFPLEYHPELLGDYAELQSAKNRMFGITLAALIGIFLLMQAAFNSWRLAALAFIVIPTGIVGGLLAVLVAGGVLTLGSLVGLLAVLGITARNGILLINKYQYLQRHESETFGADLVQRGTREEVVPILMTAGTTAVALLPFLFFGEIAGLEIIHSMAVVILGGLATSTLLTLFLLPALYLRFGVSSTLEEDI